MTLTKSGDLLMVLSLPGVDYESLDAGEQQYAVKRLESALKMFGTGFHIYQYLFKTNRPEIPFASYGDDVVDAAIDQRRQFFNEKREQLYRVEIFYAIVLEGERSKTGIMAALKRLPNDPRDAAGELKAQFTGRKMKVWLRKQIDADATKLQSHVQNFVHQLSDFMRIETLGQQEQFTFFRRLLNSDDWRIAGRPKATQFLDYQVVNSDVAAERDHLRVGDHYVRLLTMKEAVARPVLWCWTGCSRSTRTSMSSRSGHPSRQRRPGRRSRPAAATSTWPKAASSRRCARRSGWNGTSSSTNRSRPTSSS